MRYRLIFTEIALEEFQEAVDWHKDKSSRPVEELEGSIEHLFNRIEDNPFQFPILYDDRRKAILLEFPYKIIFYLEDDTAVIIAFVHHSRDPLKWSGR